MRSIAILIAGLMALTAVANVGAGLDNGTNAWRAKADAALLQRYDAGDRTLHFVVQGPRVPPPAHAPTARADWDAYWAQASRAFAGGVRADATRLGGRVTSTVPAIDAVWVTMPRASVPAMLSRGDVRLAGADWMGATFILGFAPTGPVVESDLSETASMIQAPDLWALGYHGEGVKLAMIDTGMRPTHEMLRNADGSTRVAAWADVTTTPDGAGYCATPCDANGHGTHTASTAAGSRLYNASSPQGVAPAATIIGVRIFQGGGGTWEVAQAGLQKAFDLGADITSDSWGGSCGGAATTTADLAEQLQSAGMISVFAAGNAGPGPNSVGCPGKADLVTTVGAIDTSGNIASFSSRGPCTWPESGGATRVCPDVVAVGVNVNAAINTCDTCYETLSGTSMATPHVAGATVLLEQAKRALTGRNLSAADKESEILFRYTAKDLGAVGPDNDYGWGLVQAKAAYDVLATQGAFALKDVFGSGPSVLHGSQSSALSYAVANLGSVAVSGHLTHTVRQLDNCASTCEAITIADKDVALDPARELVSSYSFAGSAHAAGHYRVTAVLSYSYVDPVDGTTKTGDLTRSGDFLLKKVQLVAVRGVPARATTGSLLGGVTLRNVGNENASNVRFTEQFDGAGYSPVPQVPPDASSVNGVFASPAPSSVITPLLLVTGTYSYLWNVGALDASGGEWRASYGLVATQPGSYVFHGTLQYYDESGAPFTVSADLPSVVALPP